MSINLPVCPTYELTKKICVKNCAIDLKKNNLYPSILGRLDRETKAVHQLTFLAETKTSPTLNSYFKLTVQVLDSNDNAPEFQSDPYDIMVSEALAPGTDVVQVQALDPDFGANGEIRYFFTLNNLMTYLYYLIIGII